MTGPKILVVDDDPIAIEVTLIRLEGAGYPVSAAETGREALALVQSERPAFVLLDVTMPDGSGLEVLRQLPKPGPSIILHSARSRAELEGMVRDHGLLGSIEKTGDDARFLDDLAGLIRRAGR